MFSWIKNQIALFHIYRDVKNSMSPEQIERFESASTEEEKVAVAIEIIEEIYPGIPVS